MSSTNSTVVVFGRLNWNISQEVSFSLSDISKWINVFGALFEFTVIIFFVFKFCNKTSTFRQPYFIIYTIGCFVDALPKILVFFNTYIYRNIVATQSFFFFAWYNSNFITLWNFLLALNRFFAILFTLQFSKIWSKRNTTIICIFLLFYPFLIHCFNPLTTWCHMIRNLCPLSLRMSVKITEFEIYFSYISDISYAILATILCFVAALNIVIKKKAKNQNVEIALLIQSLTISVFLILSTVTSWLASVNGASPDPSIEFSETLRAVLLQTFFNALSKFFYDFHHYIGLLLLLIMSRNFRTKYLEFYKITALFKRFKKAVKAETGATITVVPPASNPASPRIAHITTSTFLR